ncbi:MAG: ATP-binding protein [Erysipelotrichaceae bacterium]|nr:ATP-binding protein [Erysipelotrichaceae bacterium]MDD3809576.1 ATP-binding protein [Erysipelotrichaceae bacterium]
MYKVLVLSGKGGTGKTTIASSLIELFDSKVFGDVDVDAPNLFLLNRLEVTDTQDYYGLKKAIIDPEKCIKCGKCVEHCKFKAIEDYQTITYRCEGCGVCEFVCPAGAITMVDNVCGQTFEAIDANRKFYSAKLKMGEGNSGKLVTQVKSLMPEQDTICIIDGSPGVGCPVIAAMANVDLILLVCEATMSGLADMKRTYELSKSFNLKAACIINRFDLSLESTEMIESYLKEENITLVGKVPNDSNVVKCINQGLNVVDFDIPAAHAIRETARNLKKIIERG